MVTTFNTQPLVLNTINSASWGRWQSSILHVTKPCRKACCSEPVAHEGFRIGGAPILGSDEGSRGEWPLAG
ncbi:MAG: hypothetical protein OHK0050_35280 [Roseiflexaceae bacterium]